MKRGNFTAICAAAVSALSISATPAFAYLGPGAGLAAIGTFLALVVGVVAAFLGFVWYPMKRLLGKRKVTGAAQSEPRQTPHAASVKEAP
jgi:hypothetical protein